MLRKITTNYHKNFYKITDETGKILKTADLYWKRIKYEDINERLVRFFQGYKDEFDFLNEMTTEFLSDREADIYKNYLREFRREKDGKIIEEILKISSLEKDYRIKYIYNDFFDILKKEIHYEHELVCVINYVYNNNRLEYIRKLGLNGFDPDEAYFDFGENMECRYSMGKLSYIKTGDEEFHIEYIGDIDIRAESSKRRFEFKLDEEFYLKKIKTYVYYEEKEEIKEIFFMEKEFFYENGNLIKRIMKINEQEYISEYTYGDFGMERIITNYKDNEIYRKSFDNFIEEKEVFQKYEDTKAYSVNIKNNKIEIEIPEDYLKRELDMYVYNKQSEEGEIKTGRIYVTDDEIINNKILYDKLVMLSSNIGTEKYEGKDYIELDFFQKNNLLLLDPQNRNIIFLKTKWYI